MHLPFLTFHWGVDGMYIWFPFGGLNDLVAPTINNNGGATIEWGGFGTLTNALSPIDGAANTATIVNCLTNSTSGGCPGNIGIGTYAAGICSTYSANGGYTSGWFLPAVSNTTSTGQQNCLYTNAATIGGFAGAVYWSSTELDSRFAFFQDFSDGSQFSDNKFFVGLVRCVRGFTP